MYFDYLICVFIEGFVVKIMEFHVCSYCIWYWSNYLVDSRMYIQTILERKKNSIHNLLVPPIIILI